MTPARHIFARFRSAAALAALLTLAACTHQGSTSGYHWESLYRQDVSTVAVPIFQNKDYRRGIEFSLSKAVINEMEAHTPYKVAPREKADTILEGEIVSATVTNLSLNYNTTVPQEQMMVLTVNFTWKDLRSGQILVRRTNFQQTATFYPTLGEGEFAGTQDAVEKLALSIVRQMQAEW